MEKFTPEDLGLPDLIVSQPQNGYRYTSDAVVLAHLAKIDQVSRIIDAGCGCGIISLILARRNPQLEIFGIEIQKELADYAAANTVANQSDRQIQVLNMDLNQLSPEIVRGPVDLLISNPPYKKRGSGRLNPAAQKAVSRHEIKLDIDQLFKSADRLLSATGKVCVIFPSDRFCDIENAASAHKFKIHTVQMIHSHPDRVPHRVIVSADRYSTGPPAVLSPIIL